MSFSRHTCSRTAPALPLPLHISSNRSVRHDYPHQKSLHFFTVTLNSSSGSKSLRKPDSPATQWNPCSNGITFTAIPASWNKADLHIMHPVAVEILHAAGLNVTAPWIGQLINSGAPGRAWCSGEPTVGKWGTTSESRKQHDKEFELDYDQSLYLINMVPHPFAISNSRKSPSSPIPLLTQRSEALCCLAPRLLM